MFHNIPYFSLTATTCQSPEIGKPAAEFRRVIVNSRLVAKENATALRPKNHLAARAARSWCS